MTLTASHLHRIHERHAGTLRQLEILYHEMDAAYAAAANRYGFECRGCDDNCCLTLFYHHTLVETAGLLAGFQKMPANQKADLIERAKVYSRALSTSPQHDQPPALLCPLNVDSQCQLYRHRPMICRLHGIPHIMRHPARGLIRGPGCHNFETTYGQADGHPLDRTPLYTAMAGLERSLRQASGIDRPVRLTIAQMILLFGAPL
jgi:hypothetical protein